MNVIFLDIDGVLNCGSYLKKIHNDVKELVKKKILFLLSLDFLVYMEL